ncbi:hypothetical protein [Nocardiopsis sp. YSL2]|uniref:hypothetical protein n=1 Tax=Nocardiopsis sp. YSL2 TaxID=2939492 RepID=UPI0026F41094|nr:hypothetical protein [Nocardiopsis sp. YSL2]
MSENSNENADAQHDRVIERPVARECAWCGTAIEVKPRAQHQRYCGRSCRQRAYEVRTAAARQEADQAAGTARPDEPVREVVERVTVRTVRRGRPASTPPWPAPAPRRVVEVPVEVPVVASPKSAREAADFMTLTAVAISDGTIGVYDHKRVYQGVKRLLAAFDKAHPGGLERLMGGQR